jgi:hypothetical protein
MKFCWFYNLLSNLLFYGRGIFEKKNKWIPSKHVIELLGNK